MLLLLRQNFHRVRGVDDCLCASKPSPGACDDSTSNPRKLPKSANVNILKEGQFYHHHELQLTPSMPSASYDADGNIIMNCQPFYLEIKSSYTLSDLLSYFERSFNIKIRDQAKAIGQLDWMVGKYGIEEVLFMIDIAIGNVMDGAQIPTEPFHLQKYSEQAKEDLMIRKCNDETNGFDHEIKRAV